jgi:hypothetical protein
LGNVSFAAAAGPHPFGCASKCQYEVLFCELQPFDAPLAAQEVIFESGRFYP